MLLDYEDSSDPLAFSFILIFYCYYFSLFNILLILENYNNYIPEFELCISRVAAVCFASHSESFNVQF